jgi:ABC-2 type transport system permease protein
MKGIKKHPIVAVIIREAERIKLNPAYRFLLFAGPMIGILLLFFIFKQGTVKELPIALVDQDHSSLSSKISLALDATTDINVLVSAQDMFQAKKLLEKGTVEAIVLIPDNMEKSVFQGMEAPLPIYINGTNVLKSGLIQRSVLTTLKTVSGGIQLKKLMLSGNNKEEAINRIIPVNIQKHVLFNPYTNYSYFLNSAMLYVMLYLFVFLSSIYTLGNELKRGTGENLLKTSNNSVRMAIAGKMIPYTIIFSGFSMFINILLYKVLGMPLNGSFAIIFLGQIITIITYQLMGLIFVGVTINLRLAMSLGSAYSMMGVTFSGLTFPLEGMPLIAKIVATLFPFTWWEKLFISQSLRNGPISEALPYLCYILLFQLLSLCFLKVYKNYLGKPKYWGKL